MNQPLLDRLRMFDESEAVVVVDRAYRYAELLQAVEEWRAFLSGHGIAPGDIVSLEGMSSVAAYAGLLALIECAAIVVPLTPLPAAKRAEFLELAEVETSITIDDQGHRSCERTGRHAEHALYATLRGTARPGLVLFSSGTSGRSKASVLDFTKVLSRYGEPTRPLRIISFLNIDHIGGINTLFHTLSQGGTIVTVPERTPDRVFAAVVEHRVQVLPTTPTFLNMVLISGVLERYTPSSLELITYGTEPMPPQTLRRLKVALPDVRFKQTYGLSELGILPTRSKGDDSVWLKIGGAGFAHKIIDDVLWIRSDMAMLGYLNAPAPFDDEGFFNTQDVVRTDGPYIQILGRRSEVINVGGEKVYPAEVENVLLQLPNVAEATVSGHPSPVTGMVVRATVQLVDDEDHVLLRRRVREHCRGRLEPYKIPAVVDVAAAPQHSDRFKKVRRAT
ncbi:MAG: long-chain fatty acid--CoA ligase [Actinobacteria bacterium]|nr:long-chain fatty acid--CoA ligase [Actinomycetota bacterium]MBI3686781.1 long-chain fatty acid--CoA ligase [Actinomycetota bacterium]